MNNRERLYLDLILRDQRDLLGRVALATLTLKDIDNARTKVLICLR